MNYISMTLKWRPDCVELDAGANKISHNGFTADSNSKIRVTNKSFIAHQLFCPESTGSRRAQWHGANKKRHHQCAQNAKSGNFSIFAV